MTILSAICLHILGCPWTITFTKNLHAQFLSLQWLYFQNKRNLVHSIKSINPKQSILIPMIHKSWIRTTIAKFKNSLGTVSLVNLEHQEPSKIKFNLLWKVLRQAKPCNGNISITLLCFPSPRLCPCFLLAALSPAGHLLAWWRLTYAPCCSHSHFDPCISHKERDSCNMDNLSGKEEADH
jgi:hypothetical protein